MPQGIRRARMARRFLDQISGKICATPKGSKILTPTIAKNLLSLRDNVNMESFNVLRHGNPFSEETIWVASLRCY